MKILILNGPNLNMLGIRETNIYGQGSYQDLLDYLHKAARELNIEIECQQSNHEGALIDLVQAAYKKYDGIIINPAGYTHTSIALMDAIKAVAIPAVEVHLSDLATREDFRKFSYTALACQKTITGKGFAGYREAMEYLVNYQLLIVNG